jgi:alpha-beta hydrolase superfamily lysophospholipase
VKRVAFIIPGYKFLPKHSEYQQIGSYFESINIKPIYIEVIWDRTAISESLKSFLKIYEATQADEKYILGFSFGAVIAFLASSQVKFKAQILCSLSPYFKEDLPKIKKWWARFLGKRRYADFYSLEVNKLVTTVTTPTFLMYGTEESTLVAERACETFQNLQTSKELISIQGVKHDLSDIRYLTAIDAVIKSFNSKKNR